MELKTLTPPELAYTFVGHLADPSNGAKMYLLNPIVVRLRQEQVILAYPFHYLSAVNARANEIVLNYENRKNFTGCDDLSLINPTCGLKHERGKAVLFSEGFCCFCPEMPVNEKQPRGGQDCSLNVGNDPYDFEKQKYKASAHCLHFSEIWYSVSAVNEPFILHETFLQVYIQKHFKNSSSGWFALTHDEDFALGPQNTYQYDDNKTIVLSYLTDSPKDKAITIPLSNRRLLTPQPMPAVELSKLPTPVLNGATDYLLLPKDVIDPEGDVCDVAGVWYKAFALQPDRCSVPKDTCLKNQPLDFWDADDEKRSASAKGDYLLENFGIPYKDPIIVDPETKEHWLALEYHEPHHTVIFIEVNADEISVLSIGKYAQISKISSSLVKKSINIHTSILNNGLMPAKFIIQAVKCTYGVPDSNKESVIIPPQWSDDILITTTQGSTSLDEKFTCTVQVSSESYEVIAEREISIHPHSRCVCNFHCECACMSDSLKCELMSEEDYHAAGFRGSLPILTAKPPYRIWLVAHPFLAILALLLFMLLIGLIKSILGLVGLNVVGNFGMDKIIYRPGKIKKYPQADLKNMEVVYDDEGYPIHPDTHEHVKLVSDGVLIILNIVFLFFWPCLLCKQCCKKMSELKKKWIKETNGNNNDDDDLDIGNEDKKIAKKKSAKKFFFRKKIGKKGEDSAAKKISGKTPIIKGSKQMSAEMLSKPGDENKEHTGFYQSEPKASVIRSEETLTSGPIADPLNKERERWYKGKQKIDVITK